MPFGKYKRWNVTHCCLLHIAFLKYCYNKYLIVVRVDDIKEATEAIINDRRARASVQSDEGNKKEMSSISGRVIKLLLLARL